MFPRYISYFLILQNLNFKDILEIRLSALEALLTHCKGVVGEGKCGKEISLVLSNQTRLYDMPTSQPPLSCSLCLHNISDDWISRPWPTHWVRLGRLASRPLQTFSTASQLLLGIFASSRLMSSKYGSRDISYLKFSVGKAHSSRLTATMDS